MAGLHLHYLLHRDRLLFCLHFLPEMLCSSSVPALIESREGDTRRERVVLRLVADAEFSQLKGFGVVLSYKASFQLDSWL